ncbi:MAG: hypothetical protein ABIJ40_03505 [Bacteroidota bacterium]
MQELKINLENINDLQCSPEIKEEVSYYTWGNNYLILQVVCKDVTYKIMARYVIFAKNLHGLEIIHLSINDRPANDSAMKSVLEIILKNNFNS